MAGLAGMMFLTVADVFLRYAFNRPILGSYELVQYMLLITVGVGLAYCALEKGHVTIDTVTAHLPRQARAIVNILVGFLGLVVTVLIAWQTCVYVISLKESQVVSTALLIPVYPFVAFLAFGIAFFCLVLLMQLLELVLNGMRR
jgi:TRAP-type C4-dicarboxylate transport system permease small subunit